MKTLVRWAWPGNIPDWKIFAGRSVILTPGLVLQVPLSELHARPEIDLEETETLRDKERQHILRALRECNGQTVPRPASASLQAHHASVQAEWFGIGSRRVSRLT